MSTADVPGQDRQGRRDVMLVALAALAVRLAGGFASQWLLPVLADDTQSFYLPIARSLLSGHGFRLGGSYTDAALIPPLYPLWLAAHMVFTGPEIPLWLIAITNAVLRTAACVALFVLTRRAFGRPAAIAAAGIYILDPWEAFWTGYVLKESLAVALVLLGVVALDRAARAGTRGAYAAAGAMIGLATLVRVANGALALALVLVAVLALRNQEQHHARRAATRVVAGLVVMLAVLSPWMARNWLVVGQPVLSTHFVGQKLYTSNGPGVQPVSDGYYAPKGIDYNLTGRDAVKRPTQQDTRLLLMTGRHMLLHPREQLSRVATKVANMWRPTFARSSLPNVLVLGGSYVILMLVSLGGILIALRRREACLALGVSLAVFFAVHVVFRGEIRNRQYLMPMLYAFGGLALAVLADRLRLIRARGA